MFESSPNDCGIINIVYNKIKIEYFNFFNHKKYNRHTKMPPFILTKAYLQSNFDFDCEKIYLHGKHITQMEEGCFENFERLKYLDLSKNSITEINNIKLPKTLINLDLSRNRILEIKGLEGLIKLQGLYLSYNFINEIKNLEDLVSLTNMDLIGNQIDEIKGLEKLIHLKRLDLSCNRILEIKGLDNLLLSLNGLYLSNNPIIDDTKVSYYKSLRPELTIYYNKLKITKNVKCDSCSGEELPALNLDSISLDCDDRLFHSGED